MKRFNGVLANDRTTVVSFDADHFSVNSQTGGHHFYRRKLAATGGRAEDVLIGTMPGNAIVSLDETVTVVEGTGEDLTDDLVDKLEAAGLSVSLDAKIKISVSLIEE